MQVTIHYTGGPMDGSVTFDSDTLGYADDDPAVECAKMFYAITQGVVGKASMGVTPALLQQMNEVGPSQVRGRAQKYRVISCHDEGTHRLISAQYFE